MKAKQPPKESAIKSYKRLFSYVLPFWKAFSISILGYLIYAATQPLFAALIQYIVDTLQVKNKEAMMMLPVFLLSLIVVRGIGTYLGTYFLAKVSTNVVHELRCDIFNKYTQLPTAFFDSKNSGYLMSLITHNVNEVTQATTDAVRTFVREGLTVIGLLGYLFYIQWQLSLIFLCVTPLIVLMVSYVSKRLRRLSKLIQDSVGNISHITSEMINGNRVVRSYGGKDYEKQRFLDGSRFNQRQSLKLATTMAIHNPLLQLLIGVTLAALMYLALYIMEDASAGEFVSYLTAAFFLPRPIRQLSEANSHVQKGIAAADSLFKILDESDEPDRGTYQTKRATGILEFKNVSFSYPNSSELALDNVSFKVYQGQTVALVGASGGGKSTITQLILRFYAHQKGKILLDDVEINDYQLDNLRQQIALVTQHLTLFNDSVTNNIAYGALSNATEQQITLAAESAYALEFITKMKQGFDTEIGENGVKLSGGQKQRLAIARALLKNAPLLILDEATSALDAQSERYIQSALTKIMQNRTSLIIAHRLSTIEHADLILVVEHGKIVERGTHHKLLEKGGAYAHLYGIQFKERPRHDGA
ncbi:MAG: lipid A export permease/ATP-binding protein MsbA [Methylococcales bacterium]|nr:lipid A export permease/ATP-binding protein MsbA [Methylococcales bacterium]